MVSMNSKERVQRAFHFDKPDKVPASPTTIKSDFFPVPPKMIKSWQPTELPPHIKGNIANLGKFFYKKFIYSWNDSKVPTKMLADKWIEFGNKHACPWFRAVIINERVFAVFKNLLNKKNFNVTKEDTINCVWREK